MPGWMRPANLTPGMCLEEQLMPSKSQMALALHEVSALTFKRGNLNGESGTVWDITYPKIHLRSP